MSMLSEKVKIITCDIAKIASISSNGRHQHLRGDILFKRQNDIPPTIPHEINGTNCKKTNNESRTNRICKNSRDATDPKAYKTPVNTNPSQKPGVSSEFG